MPADKNGPYSSILRPQMRPITFRQLLQHTNGLASESHPFIQAQQATEPKLQSPEDACCFRGTRAVFETDSRAKHIDGNMLVYQE